ncbi:DUF1800 domain-containing protein [Vannielia sp.]|uniref:DUF1800 domain-containing protein n=1 Tax=Vannielia sp. TaxID=2813045 RepID=UPI00263022AC|nr:DUF1800 domain-containing protein [Vannielia sp.]MDF1872177.1 DUF1800 domain-containing protein [Vannielia sp.]
MSFDPEIAAIRFGYGLSPRLAAPESAAAMVAALSGPDTMARTYPIPTIMKFAPQVARIQALQKAKKEGDPTAEARLKAARKESRVVHSEMLAASVARAIESPDGLRERLTRFWADHFTVVGKGPLRLAPAAYVEDAIRPNVTARFADMLKAVVTHPMMLVYLDQVSSVGPGSQFAANRRAKGRSAGLNENLAREVLELHSLGVGGSYDQDDVRQLAELFAGLWANPHKGFTFLQRRGEPGAEEVLGKIYGAEKPRLADIMAALEDIAHHPDTAAHIARKLVVHFVADEPPEALVRHLTARFLDTGGDLMALYTALLEHPEGWVPLQKVKQPFGFTTSALRALGLSGGDIIALDGRAIGWAFTRPWRLMGQPWEQPNGPDGWPEEASHWLTPQGLAVRINWAMELGRLKQITRPDPRTLVEQALGGQAGERIRFAAKAAESVEEGVALVLASPDFQKR